MTREEAINEIKSWSIPSKKGREVLETLIPELRESEDERIRKELIEFIKWSVDRRFMREDFHQAKRPSEWIAYLEKQKEPIDPFDTKLFQDGVKEGRRLEREDIKKEQKPLSTEETELNSIAFLEQMGYTCIPPGAKPAEYLDKDKVYAIMKKLTSLSFCIPLGSDEEKQIHEITSDVRSLLDYPIEQKPADDEAKAIAYREYERGRESGLRDGQKYVLDNAESYGLCKPSEWSEEDEYVIDKVIEWAKIVNPTSTIFEKVPKERFIERLKSLRPQPKQSVNDTVITPNKEFFQWVYDRLVNVHNENPNVDYMISFKRRIEELSVDKPSWKPSEEHFQGLRRAITKAEKGSDAWNSLTDLYEHLKKL